MLGDSTLLNNISSKFDIIFANINRNIILTDLRKYVQTLNTDGKIFLSGFYKEDLNIIKTQAEELGLQIGEQKIDNNWTAVMFRKLK